MPTQNRAELIEALASIEHDRWSHWQKYLHSTAEHQPDGSLRLAPELVRRWEKQMNSDYMTLTEEEKDSDREQVMKYLPMIESWLFAKGERG